MNKKNTSSSTPTTKLLFGLVLIEFMALFGIRSRKQLAQRLSEVKGRTISKDTVQKWFYQHYPNTRQLTLCTKLFGVAFAVKASPELAAALGLDTTGKTENLLEKPLEKERAENKDLKAQLKFAREMIKEMGGSNGVMKNGDEEGNRI